MVDSKSLIPIFQLSYMLFFIERAYSCNEKFYNISDVLQLIDACMIYVGEFIITITCMMIFFEINAHML